MERLLQTVNLAPLGYVGSNPTSSTSLTLQCLPFWTPTDFLLVCHGVLLRPLGYHGGVHCRRPTYIKTFQYKKLLLISSHLLTNSILTLQY